MGVIMSHQKPGNSPRNDYNYKVLYDVFIYDIREGNLVLLHTQMVGLDEFVKSRISVGNWFIIEHLEEWSIV